MLLDVQQRGANLTISYYDKEGNLYLTKKETIDGVKTISENVSYQIER